MKKLNIDAFFPEIEEVGSSLDYTQSKTNFVLNFYIGKIPRNRKPARFVHHRKPARFVHHRPFFTYPKFREIGSRKPARFVHHRPRGSLELVEEVRFVLSDRRSESAGKSRCSHSTPRTNSTEGPRTPGILQPRRPRSFSRFQAQVQKDIWEISTRSSDRSRISGYWTPSIWFFLFASPFFFSRHFFFCRS